MGTEIEKDAFGTEERKDDIEELKTQLISLQERQEDYDNLQKRLDEFERGQENNEPVKMCGKCAKVEKKEANSNDADKQEERGNEIDEGISNIFQKEHEDIMLKCFNEISKLKIMKARRATHEKRFKRYSAISLVDNASAEAQMAKLHKFVTSQGKFSLDILTIHTPVSKNIEISLHVSPIVMLFCCRS